MKMPMPPPPPHPTKMMPEPPPPPNPKSVTVSQLVSPFSLTAAVFVFGGYPQVPLDAAIAELKRRIMTQTQYSEICPTTLWMLGRRTFGKEFKYL